MSKTFKLTGVSALGKNRIREHGTKWELLEQTSPFRLHQRLFRSVQTDHLRWIDLTNDKNLEIVSLER